MENLTDLIVATTIFARYQVTSNVFEGSEVRAGARNKGLKRRLLTIARVGGKVDQERKKERVLWRHFEGDFSLHTRDSLVLFLLRRMQRCALK